MLILFFSDYFKFRHKFNLFQKPSIFPPDLEDKLFKSQALWDGAYKNRTDQPGQIEWPKCSIKIQGVNFGSSILDNSNWNKIYEGIIKKFISGIHIFER